MNKKKLITDIIDLKRLLAGRVLLAAHHYQSPEIVQLADVVGDSYRLAVVASESPAEFIIICGVRFMAESAAILSRKGQHVFLPNFSAGCPMADMTTPDHAEHALTRIAESIGEEAVPITYMNCWADLKALAGAHGGSVCTSGNATKIVAQYLNAGRRVLFMPDKNLGINTALALGLSEKDICHVSAGGDVFSRDPTEATIFLWDGYCPVHQVFTLDQVASARNAHPGSQVIVHPECTKTVVQAADIAASTDQMVSKIEGAGPQSVTVIGTEHRFIERMICEYPDREIYPLEKTFCHDMDMITLDNLYKVLRALTVGSADAYAVQVSEQDREYAKRALTSMVEITERS
ncbi:MAG TPA: quinolinate synthase [Treponema sp.]|nr:quinolinate synthase [Treponema sp.]